MESGPSKKTPDNLVPFVPSERDGWLPISFLYQVLFCPSFWGKSENELKYRHKTSSLEPGLLSWRLKTNQKIPFKNPFTQRGKKPNLKVLTCYLHKGLGSLVPSADISTNRLLPRDCNLEERYCKKLKPRIKLWFVSDFTWPFEVGVFCRFSAEFFVNLEET